MHTPPILFIVFNRPSTTKRVFEAIRAARPERLYFAADGPRGAVQTDNAKSDEVKKIIDDVDWPCEVKTLFQKKNLGCKWGPITAIDWFFENEEAGIILEDDCLPDSSFFSFCAELLSYYKNDERIMHISGNNFQRGIKRGDASYYFSKYSHSWGWATWRRAWVKFHPAINGFTDFDKSGSIKRVPVSRVAQNFWLKNFRSTIKGNDSWDSLWMYTVWYNDGLCILPNVNLVTNIGFGEDATHTKKSNGKDETRSGGIDKVTHPKEALLDQEADEYAYDTLFKQHLIARIISRIL